MCAIVGIAGVTNVEERAWLAAGSAAMRHRGPDDVGEWWSPDGRVGLAHRRLAILDLSPAGHQPMVDAQGELCIVFNGEIYNFAELRAELAAKGHAFRSSGDTEVILAAYREWGRDCLAHLNGMFAFAIHDQPRHRVFLARDRAGEKPLFVSVEKRRLRFASELKGLLADLSLPRRIDRAALDSYLYRGYVPGAQCLVEGFRKLPAAHALEFDLGTGVTRQWRYWAPPELEARAARGDVDEEALIDELDALLESAVRRQLVADVPVGVLLSGGVDSSLIAAMAARVAPRVRTFTVGFPGHGRYDETSHARLIAGHFGTEHVELEADQSSVELLPMLARQFDEPVMDSSMIPTYMVCRLIRQHCTVALGGDGGDELFGGYPHHSGLLWMKRGLRGAPRWLRRPFGELAQQSLPPGFRGRRWLQNLGADFEHGAPPPITQCFERSLRAGLMAEPGLLPLDAECRDRGQFSLGSDLLQRVTREDFGGYLADDILVKVDRASMLSSLEVRAPMLDLRLVEFAFARVPSRLKADPNNRKILLKRLTRRLLPPSFDHVRKQGFSIPLDDWLKAGPWRDYFADILLSAGSLFDAAAVRRLLEGQRRGLRNGERLFGMVLLELWRREYEVML